MRHALLLIALAACPASPAPSTPTLTPAPPPATPQPAPDPAPPDEPVPSAGDACTSDADCVITTWAGCCACPGCEQGPPTARSSKALAAAQKQCELVRCTREHCKAQLCRPGEPADAFVAHCTQGTCTSQRR